MRFFESSEKIKVILFERNVGKSAKAIGNIFFHEQL
jgi:hypothetical protein